MTQPAAPDPTDPAAERLYALVAAYEDALTAGRPPPSAALLSPDQFDRFVRAIGLIHRLHQSARPPTPHVRGGVNDTSPGR